MQPVMDWLESTFAAFPLPVLEVWGRLSFVLGLLLAVCAFGGFTLRPGGAWGLGRERQAWDARALLSIPLTFLLIVVSGWVGSSIVLVPGAQTFESLKDLVVLLCLVLFGYPALITVPFAYGLSDLIEGVPPEFLLGWLPGYFINPACFWVAYQLIGKDPDFRRAATWRRYALFVGVFMALEPVLWGYVCSDRFTPAISYRTITPALTFTTSITWVLGPPAFLVALPLARLSGLYWAEIPGHVRERVLGRAEWCWESGPPGERAPSARPAEGVPIRMLILIPFAALVLVATGTTAWVTLRSAREDADKLASRLHEEVSLNIDQRLDRHLREVGPARLDELFERLPIAEYGRAFLLDRQGRVLAPAAAGGDPVVAAAVAALRDAPGGLSSLTSSRLYRFDHLTARPLSRETWLARATAYDDPSDQGSAWVMVTVMPEAFYLAGVREGNSRSALVFTLALLTCLLLAAVLAWLVTVPLRDASRATLALARGDLGQRVPGSRLEELDTLSHAFNEMADRLKRSFDDLLAEVETRKRSERELQASQEQLREREEELRRHRDRLEDLVANRTRALERSERRTNSILEHLADGVITFDQQGRIQDFSAVAGRIFGYTAEEVLGREVRLLVPTLDPAAPAGDDFGAREVVGQSRDGRELALELSQGAVELGSERLLTCVVRDISGRKAAEDALRVAKEQADAANQAKSVFLANMSHEIRTPMNAILGFSQLLERDPALAPLTAQREYVDAILRSGEHLLRLIDDVLELAKIEAGRVTLQRGIFDLPQLLNGVDAMFRLQAQDKGLRLELRREPDLPRRVWGDEGKLRQVLINIVGNAVKFTGAGGVTLTASAGAGRLRIAVRDTGPGIAPHELPRVFEAFEQTQSGVHSGKGTGLGMSISRRYARLLGGDIDVDSQVGAGSTFTLDIPLEPAGSEPAREVAPQPRFRRLPPGREVQVLVADDLPENRILLTTLLRAAGFEVREAVDGQEALDLWAAWTPQVVLMDMRMPVLDGYEATRRIKASPRGDATKVIAVTASALDLDSERIRNAGADAVIRKPFRAEELLDELARVAGLEYEDAPGPPGATGPAGLTSAASTALAPALRTELREATLAGDAARLRELVGRLERSQPALAGQLRALVERYDYERLSALLGPEAGHGA